MIRRHRHGRAIVWVLGTLAVLALAWLAVPVNVVARALLFLAVLGVGMGVLLGTRPMVDRLLPWVVGLLVVAVGWPMLTTALHHAARGLPSIGSNVVGSRTGALAYDGLTCLMLLGLVLLAAVVLLVCARVRASLPPSAAAPRAQVRRRARLVEPPRGGDGAPAAAGRREPLDLFDAQEDDDA
jgi:hypothetical protein